MADNGFSFPDYLAAKEPLDDRSLNSAVRETVLEHVGSTASRNADGRLRVLDVGTGTGAMIRRISAWVQAMPAAAMPTSLELVGIDNDPELLKEAELKTAPVAPGARFVRRDLSDSGGGWGDREAFGLITAHAVLDLLPLDDTVSLLDSLLAPSGGIYATVNYDGLTELIPPHADVHFEEELLAWYNRSMDLRSPSAGSRTGRRLPDAAVRAGLTVEAVGASDWVIAPSGQRYRGRDAEFAGYLLTMIGNEGRRNPSLPSEALARWEHARLQTLQDGRLIIIVHQLDLFARARDRKSGANSLDAR